MAARFLVARNPDPDSQLPYLLFVPVGRGLVQVRYSEVPIVFLETRPLAEEWTYRRLGAALAEAQAEGDTWAPETEGG